MKNILFSLFSIALILTSSLSTGGNKSVAEGVFVDLTY